MIKIIDGSIENFYEDLENKRLFLFGAGRRAFIFYEELELSGKITAIIDNNERLWMNSLCLGKERIPVISAAVFVKEVQKKGISDMLLLITPGFYMWNIVEQLDSFSELDNLKCYIGDLLMEYYEKQAFAFSQGIPKIPKKIHYCWFGKNDMPSHLRRYMESWKEKCPGYEIIRWDESNYDITKNQYMKEAYACKKWGFVPDYARLDIIYQEGGIYLDTDIELLAPLDKLLCDDMFCSAVNLAVNFGQGFGAIKGHPLIKELRDVYDDKSFYNEDGSMNLMPCYVYQNPVLKKHGFQARNQYQKKDGVVIYPSEVAAPTGMKGFQDNFTENTVMHHHSEFSWVSAKEKEGMKEYISQVRHRKIYRGGVIPPYRVHSRQWGACA
ncbi:MAG: hypothetical protein K2N87_05890 [Eubacterium sp.]|nr:hypothetical protein [Eubacterium sp.]